MDREKLIEVARAYWLKESNRTPDWDTAEIIVDFALSLLQWKDVALVEDLPKESGSYVVLHKRHGIEAVFWDEADLKSDLETGWWLLEIAAYIPYSIPPYNKEQR